MGERPEAYYFGTSTSRNRTKKIRSVTTSLDDAIFYARRTAAEKGGDPIVYKVKPQADAYRKTKNGWTLAEPGGDIVEVITIPLEEKN